MIEEISRVRTSRQGEATLRLSWKCLVRRARIESLSGLFKLSLKEFLNGECFPVHGLGDP
jgi:hypothetical protein